MKAKTERLARRREVLIARSAGQREQLAESYQQLQKPIRLARMVAGAIQTLKAHPAFVMGLAALLVGTRKGKWQRLLGRAWLSWEALRRLQALWSKGRA